MLVLTATGWEWAIKSRADSGIISRQISAIVTDDSNLSTATVAPPAPGSYAPENILLLGSDTRSGANGDAGNTDASTGDGVANSDTQMIAHISGDRQHVTVLSIPRDTMIDGPHLQHLGRGHRPDLRQRSTRSAAAIAGTSTRRTRWAARNARCAPSRTSPGSRSTG